jgi:hypothetical protein
MTAIFATLAFILSIAWWANPLVRNDTVSVIELIGLRKRRDANDKKNAGFSLGRKAGSDPSE